MSLIFQTNDKHGYSVKFSPYFRDRFACSTCQYYGIAGRGTLYVLDCTPSGIVPVIAFDWNDGLFDVTWAENHENLIVAGAGDGSLLLFDVKNSKGPLRAFKEHSKEVNSVDWSQTRGENLVLTGSWDTQIKLWDINQPQSLNTYKGHSHIVYCVVWSPRIPGCFASASGDQSLRVWDRRTGFPQIVIPAHNAEILTCDWSKYDQNTIFTGSVDCSIKGWDIRKPGEPVCQLLGHKFAVRRIKTSPFHGSVLASCSYDFTVRTWNINQPHPMETIEHHTEFVYGLDFNLHIPGQLVDCGWDQKVRVYSPKSL